MKGDVGLFERIGSPFTIVVTNKKIREVDTKFAFVSTPKEAIELLKKKGFDGVLLGGGGRMNASFMESGFIDEIILDVEPLLFGKGIKLFADTDFEAKLELLRIKKLSKKLIRLHYRVVK